ncbi:DUF421 domain-containing protein [Salinimonas chungwhensis]|uniref:DUF421 domain-containing protein n=1 Tax=Salinimonas chungwhensis TaxID=265425 RepID=UPI00036D24E9|nr:YetF domain-containing protein [Salinimonas chungwhensis]
MIFFQNWDELARVAISTVLIYMLCVGMVSVFGKRASAKMNNFDWIVTVAMGSMLGSSVLFKKVVVLELFLALFLLLALQFSFNKLSVYFLTSRKTMKKSPALLYFSGEYVEQTLQRERVTKDEVRTGIRSQGLIDENDVSAVILEPNGELSIIPASQHRADDRDDKAIEDVVKHDH